MPRLLQITGKTAGQLNHPVPGRMLGNAERVNPACLDLDDERDIQPLQRHGVDVEEVDRQQAAGLGAQEGAPGVVAAWMAGSCGARDLADGRGGDAMSEATQLALDANHAPGPVLRRQARDQRGDLVADRRRRRLRRATRGDQPAVPAQQRSRRDNPVGAQRLRKHPGKRGQDRTIRPGQARPRIVPSQHSDLVPQCEYLRVLRRRRPGEQGKPGQHLNKEPIDQTNRHDRRSSDVTIARVKLDGQILDQDTSSRTAESSSPPGCWPASTVIGRLERR